MAGLAALLLLLAPRVPSALAAHRNHAARAPDGSRTFPENAETLRWLLREKIEYIAVSTENLGRVMQEVAAVDLDGSLQEISANEQYAVFRLARTPR